MSEETIGIIIAAIALIGLLYFVRKREMGAQSPQGSTPPIAGTLAAAANPAEFVDGPSYFIANQPWYFAPPVGNIMPAAAASRTTATNPEDNSCGCY